jgi:putative alpha-1,2-mannosidase
MSAMGFYPVCPGQPEYVLGSPLFDEVKLQLENGESVVIKAENNTSENVYIQSASLNGKNYTRNYLTHKDFTKGGELKFIMGAEPNKERGVKIKDLPYSMSKR